MKLKEKLDHLLSENAEQFASVFNCPHISPWIIKYYNKGFTSKSDYDLIVNWVTDDNPSLDNFDFNFALKKAKKHAKNLKHKKFNPYIELESNIIALNLENGYRWIEINSEDCNIVCHHLQYDYSNDLQDVYAGNKKCWILQDPQNNMLCAIINDKPFPKLLNQFGNISYKYHREIKKLCIRKGLNLGPEAFSNTELAKALNNKQLNINQIENLHKLFSRLSVLDIINGKLLRYAHYASLPIILDLYKKTNYTCLLKYLINYLLTNNMTNMSIYQKAINLVKQNPKLINYYNNLKSNDNRAFMQELENNINEIQKLK